MFVAYLEHPLLQWEDGELIPLLYLIVVRRGVTFPLRQPLSRGRTA